MEKFKNEMKNLKTKIGESSCLAEMKKINLKKIKLCFDARVGDHEQESGGKFEK